MTALKWNCWQKKYKLNAYIYAKKIKPTQTLELNFRVEEYAWSKVKFCEGEQHDSSWPQQKFLGQGLPDLVYPKEGHLVGSCLVQVNCKNKYHDCGGLMNITKLLFSKQSHS